VLSYQISPRLGVVGATPDGIVRLASEVVETAQVIPPDVAVMPRDDLHINPGTVTVPVKVGLAMGALDVSDGCI